MCLSSSRVSLVCHTLAAAIPWRGWFLGRGAMPAGSLSGIRIFDWMRKDTCKREARNRSPEGDNTLFQLLVVFRSRVGARVHVHEEHVRRVKH